MGKITYEFLLIPSQMLNSQIRFQISFTFQIQTPTQKTYFIFFFESKQIGFAL